MKKTPRQKSEYRFSGKQVESPVPLLPNQFYFYGNVPSLKNGKDIFCKDSKGKALKKPLVLPNKECREYLSEFSYQQVQQYQKWVEYIGKEIKDMRGFVLMYQFIRPNKKSTFDFTNAVEILQDALTAKVYIPQRKGNNKLKYIHPVISQIPNLSKRLVWIPEDNNTRVTPELHPEVLYDEEKAGVIISYFSTFKEYAYFLIEHEVGFNL